MIILQNGISLSEDTKFNHDYHQIKENFDPS